VIRRNVLCIVGFSYEIPTQKKNQETRGSPVTNWQLLVCIPCFGDIPKNGTGIGGGNSDNQANNFFRLINYIAAHRAFGSLGHPYSCWR
jgi:hypothetical protein